MMLDWDEQCHIHARMGKILSSVDRKIHKDRRVPKIDDVRSSKHPKICNWNDRNLFSDF